jgi:hypothetical protein
MGAAGDVEQQAMRGIERHQRGETVAPFGDGVQRVRVGSFIGIIDPHLRTDGAGIGERQADFEAKLGSRIVERKNPQHVVLPGNDNAGKNLLHLPRKREREQIQRFSLHGDIPYQLPLDAVGRQARQPQAEDTPPVLRKGTHHISIP